MIHASITDSIIKAYYTVYNELGFGFLEKVYERALLIEIKKKGLLCENQQPIKVYYDSYEVGDYYADLVVENLVIVELKAAESLAVEHEAQLTNYLRATDKEVGLLLNFGRKPEFKRKIFENRFKVNLK
ncbi:GxxExxY protein [Runella defluvii]|uniref:GxxExxY protein n=1 Tax=Runella defluvii TaxID=370973 RepID=A0A7W6EQ63_9BACT|nr:GxxExxY protein [Runella defluvii]MBB3838335.1 GxxExxY protein [Runella defluvii]